ncbi:MAG TPA: methylmalonyl-CoA carboxyltransferase, partial [Gemmatimonadetes bacterium]|nr:methylmalonyl-CoA carboxyltransferase [Gemmatimonadota bacterium]
VHSAKSGVAHFACDSEPECLAAVRELLLYLPQNNTEISPALESSDAHDRQDEKLLEVVPDNPNKPYDMHNVIKHVVDDGAFLEVHERFAQNILVG